MVNKSVKPLKIAASSSTISNLGFNDKMRSYDI